MALVDVVTWPVLTQRLLLRPYRPTDLDAVWNYRRLPEVGEWIGWIASDREAFRRGMTDRTTDRGHTEVVVELAGTVIGDVVVMPGDGWAQVEAAERAQRVQAELGWTFHPAHGGRGYATEAVGAVIDLCFGAWGFRRVQAGAFADNVASWRLMERLGMRREEHSRATALHRTRGWLDGVSYGLLQQEWPTQGSPPP